MAKYKRLKLFFHISIFHSKIIRIFAEYVIHQKT